jgi:hypothetical protein
MKWRTTAVLAVLLVGLAVFFYVYEVRQGPAREKAVAEKDRLWKGFEAKDIEDVVIARGAESIHLRKSGEAWSLVAPVAAKAESRAVDDFLASLAALRVEREIDPNPAKPSDFGLAPPAAEIAFKAKGQEHGIRLGAKSPTGIWVYAQEAAKPAVVLVPDSLLRDAQKSAADFRDRAVLAFEQRNVKGLEVHPRQGSPLSAQLKGTDEWQVTAPVAVPADREGISTLLETLRAARIKEFVTDSPQAPKEYGLDQPLRVILWLGEEKERVSKTLRLGRAVPDKKAAYAQREGEPTVFLVEETLLKAVPTSVAGLRDKTVLAFDRTKVERMELESPKGKVTLAAEGGAWRITAPVTLPADDTIMSQLLWKVRDLRAKEFVAHDAKLGRFGLDRPQVRLTLWEQEAKDPKTLLLALGKDREQAYAAVGGGGPIVVVDGKVVEELSRSPQDLQDRAVFAKFEPRDVTRVQIERAGQTFALERTGEEDWQLVAPRRGKARGPRVSELVWALRNLRWRELAAAPGAEAGRYGLDPPATTITLTGKDGNTAAALQVGTREKEDVYVRVAGRPAVYAVEAKSLGDIPASAEDLLL